MTAEMNTSLSTFEILEKARTAETEGRLEEAAAFYEQVIKQNKVDEHPFDRLMIIYRKLKQYKNEIKTINKGIKVFETFYKKPLNKKKAKLEKVTTLSNAFMKSSGLTDKKGNLLYVPEPISRWTKRKAVVEKKLK